MSFSSLLFSSVITFLFCICIGTASAASIDRRLSLSPYAPRAALCPRSPLVRPADSISHDEQEYINRRKPKADDALAAWLSKTNPEFCTDNLPIVGLTTSGGGYRSLLNGAGVVQAFDSRDSNSSVGGIYQGLTYQAGVSGGAWLLSSIAGNDWPTVSSLKASLWEQAFLFSALIPSNFTALAAYDSVLSDIHAKKAAGFDPTITDPWGRLLSYQLLESADGGVSTRLSGLTAETNFTQNNVPFPIITASNVNTTAGQCLPPDDTTIWEFTPYDFGSWDAGISAFTQTKYLGTSLTAGKPTKVGHCTVGYDNLGYVLGTSSSLFNEICSIIPPKNDSSDISKSLEGILSSVNSPAEHDIFAAYPNPFHNYSMSPAVAAQTELTLADGGEANQNNPIWPFIQPYRNLSVLIVNDNSADTNDDFPNGTQIYHTYQQAQRVSLPKMPTIPPTDTFVAQGLNKRAAFFGCNQTEALTIVWLPNVNYTFVSNVSTEKLQYNRTETSGIIGNGNAIADQSGADEAWATCLGCAIVKKTSETLPSACADCFDKYCY